jgi:nucleotide-binding universal stress UspA family protein
VAPPAAEIDETREELNRVVIETLKRRRVKVKAIVVVGEPFRCILRAAERADSIVMSTTGRTGLPHLVMGSVAERIVRLSPVPVLTVRAAAKRPARRTRTTR